MSEFTGPGNQTCVTFSVQQRTHTDELGEGLQSCAVAEAVSTEHHQLKPHIVRRNVTP